MSSPFSDKDFKQAMGQFLTGVTIVSVMKKDGSPYGLTVNSFSSVSLNPRLVLWSLIKDNSAAPDFADASSFSIAFLAADQGALCQRFASDHNDRFEGVAWHQGASGAPVIDGALCVLECASWQQYDGGDHVIHVGEVMSIHNNNKDAKPMSYFASDHKDRFEGVAWHQGASGAPVIDGALCVLECASWQQYDGGDHVIHVGEVMSIHNNNKDAKPMSYFAGKVNDI